MKKLNNKEDGWTLMETMLVLAIFMILSGGLGISGSKALEKARKISAINEMEIISAALESYQMDCRFYPSEEQGLKALWTKPLLEPVSADWNGPYTTSPDFTDPWKNEYQYKHPGEEGLPYGLISFGSDQRQGGSASAADIDFWHRKE